MALDFKNQGCREVILDRIPTLVPNATALTHKVRPSFLGRGHGVLTVGYQHQRGFTRSMEKRLSPIVCLRSGNVLSDTRRPPPRPNTMGRREYVGEIKNSHFPVAAPKDGIA